MTRVLLVDDIRLYQDSLTEALRGQPHIEAVETATDLELALECLQHFAPNVVLVNTAMTRSIDVLRAITRTNHAVPVIAVGVSESEEEVIACAEAGVAGYLFKREPILGLVALIRSVTRGETLFSPRIAGTILRHVATLASEKQDWSKPSRLTPREQEILRLIDQDLSNKQIAQKLCVEVRTVKNHVHNILEKLDVRRRGEAAALLRTASASSQNLRSWT